MDEEVANFRSAYRDAHGFNAKDDLRRTAVRERRKAIIDYFLNGPEKELILPDLLRIGAEQGDQEYIDLALDNGFEFLPMYYYGTLSYLPPEKGLGLVKYLYQKAENKSAFLEAALTVGIEIDRTDLAEFALDEGYPPNGRGDSYIPLIDAASYDNSEVLKLLLDRGADPELEDDTGKTPLIASFEHPEGKVIEILSALVGYRTLSIQGFKALYDRIAPNGTTQEGGKLIHSILVAGNIPLTKYILGVPAYKLTLGDIIDAGIETENKELIDLYLAEGASIDLDELTKAVTDLRSEIVPYLYDKSRGKYEAAALILKEAVRLRLRVAEGRYEDNRELEEKTSRTALAFATFALGNGANGNGSDEGFRPLIEAADANDLQLTELLLARGASPHVTDDMARTPLITSFNHINAELTQAILSRSQYLDSDIIEQCIFEMKESDGYNEAAEAGLQEHEGYLEDMMLSFQRLIEYTQTRQNAEEILDNGWRYVETWQLPNPAWKEPFMELLGDRAHLRAQDRQQEAGRRAAFLAGEVVREQQRQKAAEEYKATAGKTPATGNPEQKKILRWCSTPESFTGDPLLDKDLEEKKLVVFFFNKVPSNSQAECYLLSELEATWAAEDPRTYQTIYNQRREPINGQRVYKLPWANRLIPQEIVDRIVIKGERLFNLNVETPIKTKYGKSDTLTLYSGVSCPGLPF